MSIFLTIFKDKILKIKYFSTRKLDCLTIKEGATITEHGQAESLKDHPQSRSLH